MNGVHDMGGQHGFGAVAPATDEPRFHAEWEKRALGLTLAMGASGLWNLDISRATRERIPPAEYLASSYYRIWILGLEALLQRHGVVTAEELKSGLGQTPAAALPRVLRAAEVDAVLARGAPTLRAAEAPARFRLGQQVRARNMHPAGHTRLPRYVRGHVGTVVAVHGAHLLPDSHAVPRPDGSFDTRAAWLYTVRFDGAELWGADAETGTQVSIDAFEPYLEATA